MSQADYSYEIVDYHGRNVIVITDKDGRLSVTNDIENVVTEIEDAEGIKARDFMIVYSDTEETWDGWDASTCHFVYLFELNWMDAVDEYIKQQLYANKNSNVTSNNSNEHFDIHS